MTAHPYPQRVRQAVANEVCLQILGKPLVKTGDQTRHAFLADADQILSALWEASRVDTIEQLDALPYNAALIDVNGVVADDYVTHCIVDLPAHIIHWGDAV